MKIVRLIPLACLAALLSACGGDPITGPAAPPAAGPAFDQTATPDALPADEPTVSQAAGPGQLGSGN